MYKLAGKRIRSRLGIPSGVNAVKPATIELLAGTVPCLGFITTKSISAQPHEGHKPPIFAQYGPFSGINAVGLDNPGAEAFAAQLSGIQLPESFFLMVSIFGASAGDFVAAAMPLLPYADGIELNFSCPHSDKFGLKVGQNLDLALQIIGAVVALGKPVFVKLSPKMDIAHVVCSTRGLGIAGYTVGNTLGPESFLVDGQPVLTNRVGGISGRAITELTLRCIRETRRNTSLQIIGCGGISTGGDARRAIDAGAGFCAIGTGLMGISTARTPEFFSAVNDDMRAGTSKAEAILEDVAKTLHPSMIYQKFDVANVERLADDLFILHFTQSLKCGPGQYIFAWLPGRGERPFSVFESDPLALLIGVRGACTEIMSRLGRGDSVYIRGPRGAIPEYTGGNVLLIGGGTGIASLRLFAERYRHSSVALLGAKDGPHLHDGPLKDLCRAVYSVTEIGHSRLRGLVTDFLDWVLIREGVSLCLNCGPLAMVQKAIEIERRHLPENRILSSVESYMGCGTKTCGKCATASGFSPCVDGPFMTKTQLGL